MPQIRTTINPEKVVDVTERELASLKVDGLVQEIVSTAVEVPQEAATKKAAQKETR